MPAAMITGASQGLGRAVARALAARGWSLVVDARHAGQLTAAVGGLAGVTAIPGDVTDPAHRAAIAAAIAPAGRLDLLINNAGLTVSGERFGAIDLEGLRGAFSANAAGPFLLTQALAPSLADDAKVANVSSRLGSIAGTDTLYTPSYAVSKAALNMVSKLLSIALAGHGVIVVAISPGWVRTDMGGTNAPLTPADSVADMLNVIDHLQPTQSGKFLDHQGASVAW